MSILASLGFTTGNQPAAPQPTHPNNPNPSDTNSKDTSAASNDTAPNDLDTWFTPAETDYKDETFNPTQLFSDIDPKELSEAFKGVNLVQSALTPEIAAAIKEGGDDAMAAVVQLMNATSQKSVEASTQMAAALVRKALAESVPHVDRRVNSTLRERRMEEAILDSNPVFSTKAASFMVDKLKEVFTAKYPDATPAEWRDMAAKFAAELTSKASPTPDEPEKDPAEIDWNNFVERLK